MQEKCRLRNARILVVAFLLIFSGNMYSQSFTVRASAGVIHLPLSDWSNFFGQASNSLYTKNNPNIYYSLSFHYALNSDHSVIIGTEVIRSSASLSDSVAIIDWKFQGIPVTLGYEYKILTFNEHFTPFAGLGVSYFISEVDGKINAFNQTLKRTGKGYGAHASIGLISQLTASLSLISQTRYRYSNGMGFTDNEKDIKVEFTGFDFSFGLGWNLYWNGS